MVAILIVSQGKDWNDLQEIISHAAGFHFQTKWQMIKLLYSDRVSRPVAWLKILFLIWTNQFYMPIALDLWRPYHRLEHFHSMQRNSTPRKSGQIKSQFTVPIPHLKHMYEFLKFHIKPFFKENLQQEKRAGSLYV